MTTMCHREAWVHLRLLYRMPNGVVFSFFLSVHMVGMVGQVACYMLQYVICFLACQCTCDVLHAVQAVSAQGSSVP